MDIISFILMLLIVTYLARVGADNHPTAFGGPVAGTVESAAGVG